MISEVNVNFSQLNTVEINNNRIYVSEELKMKLEETRVIAILMGWKWEYRNIHYASFTRKSSFSILLTSEDNTKAFKIEVDSKIKPEVHITVAKDRGVELDMNKLFDMAESNDSFKKLDLLIEFL